MAIDDPNARKSKICLRVPHTLDFQILAEEIRKEKGDWILNERLNKSFTAEGIRRGIRADLRIEVTCQSCVCKTLSRVTIEDTCDSVDGNAGNNRAGKRQPFAENHIRISRCGAGLVVVVVRKTNDP